ncbi:hypothetical protein ALC56_07690 [Trachymyrmex septentrionalis]|uniref:Uncharacterized protein n=1 Tax=Trachymyrmex septentrionalis TaxID=34720 RepID=A0A151JVS0_9HYME|nr:hypothetical protein ALC56_07690 [Trachymyrmex septentrionalis]
MQIFLELCTEKQIILLMNGKKYKHIDIFQSLVENIEQKGFFKTAQQTKFELKNLNLQNMNSNKLLFQISSLGGNRHKLSSYYFFLLVHSM